MSSDRLAHLGRVKRGDRNAAPIRVRLPAASRPVARPAPVAVAPVIPEARPEEKSIWASWSASFNGVQAALGVAVMLSALPPEWSGPAIVFIAVFTILDRYRKSDIRKGVRSWLGLRALA